MTFERNVQKWHYKNVCPPKFHILMYSEHRKCIAACIEKRGFSGIISASVSVIQTPRGITPRKIRERWKSDLEDDGYLYGFEVKEEEKPARRKPVIYERPIEPERYYYDEPVRSEVRRKSKMRDDAR